MPNILTQKPVYASDIGSKYKRDRLFLLDEEVAVSLNKYRNWGWFGAPSQPIFDSATSNERETTNIAVPAIFNAVNAVGKNHQIQIRNNAPLLDSPETRKEMRKYADCSVKALVEASKNQELGRSTYRYADFMYCKHLGKVSNNYMVTLRRFPYPAGDHINYTIPDDSTHKNNQDTERHPPAIGTMVTWIGTPGNDMSNILKYSVNMPFQEMKSGIEEAGDAGGDSGGPLGTFLNATTNMKYRDQMVKGYAGSSTFDYMSKIHGVGGIFSGNTSPYADISGYMDKNKTYGPLDVITLTHRRDTGLDFQHEISLVFDYELRSYDGINGKAAMLDLLGNILATCYATGSFWGGMYHCSGASQSNIFANLPIFKLSATSSFSDAVDAFLDSGQTIFKKLGGGSGDLLTDAKNILSTIGQGAFSALLGAGLNKLGRPHKNAINSLLSPAPVGFWHLTIGNPWHPIMSIGNLILDGCEIEHYGPLGLDDFPTGLRVTVKLKHGKGRDSGLIETMYMMGETRVYTPVGKDVIEMYKNSDEVKAKTNDAVKQAKADIQKRAAETSVNMYRGGENNGSLSAFLNLTSGDAYRKAMLSGYAGNAEDEIKILTDTQMKAEMQNVQNLFVEMFGTSDTEVIVHASMEGAFGEKDAPKKKENEE